MEGCSILGSGAFISLQYVWIISYNILIELMLRHRMTRSFIMMKYIRTGRGIETQRY